MSITTLPTISLWADGTGRAAEHVDLDALRAPLPASWRATQGDVAARLWPTETTVTFTDANSSGSPISAGSFAPAAVAAATAIVQQAGITDPGLQQDVINHDLVTCDVTRAGGVLIVQQEGVATVQQARVRRADGSA